MWDRQGRARHRACRSADIWGPLFLVLGHTRGGRGHPILADWRVGPWDPQPVIIRELGSCVSSLSPSQIPQSLAWSGSQICRL